MSRPRTVTGKAASARGCLTRCMRPWNAARGDLDRSQWIRGLILAALDAKGLTPAEAAPQPVPAKRAARKTPERQTRGQKPKIGPPAPKGAPPPPPARALRAHPPGAVVFQDPGAEAIVGDAPPAPAATRKRCNHPGTRLIGGFCPLCDHVIEPGGYWRET